MGVVDGGVCRMKHHRRMELKVGQKQYTSVIKEVKRGGRKSRKLVRQRKWKGEEKQAFPFKLTPQLANVLNNSHTCH